MSLRLISKSVGTGCKEVPNDIRAVQCLLNMDANRLISSNTAAKLELRGKLDKATEDAIRLFQTNALKIAKPDGRVDPGGGMITRLGSALPALPSGAYAEPEWLRIAYNEEQDAPTEKAGLDDNHERILTYLSTASGLATKPVKGNRSGAGLS